MSPPRADTTDALKQRIGARGRRGWGGSHGRNHLWWRSGCGRYGGRLPSGAVHLTNGDCTVPRIRGTGIAHHIVPWRDVLHEGPVPDVADEELRRIRAAFLAAENADDIGTVEELAERDQVLAVGRHGEYVLWFEADLYDQLQIVQILAKLHELHVPPVRVTLICVGEFPGIAHFGGLGELTSEQVRCLPQMAARKLTPAALEYATRSWAALRASNPVGLTRISAMPSPDLRFVAEAYDRLSREYPSTRDGLSLTERRILAAVAQGASTGATAFECVTAKETRPFLGDTWCFDKMARFINAPSPLLLAEPRTNRVDRLTRVRLTADGRRVLAGREDHVSLNGVDRWIGGVHLTGRNVPWRWDEGTESITAVDA